MNAAACRPEGIKVETRADAEELLFSSFVAVPDPAFWVEDDEEDCSKWSVLQ